LFDPSRDPSSRVRDDDWHPGPPEMKPLEACDTVADRRRWYERLGQIRRPR
jgi:hypothetical protein